MRSIMAGLILLLVSMQVAPVRGQSAKYPPLSEYMMTSEAEIALARSAAPENVSAHATVKILTASGFKVAAQGDNGFVCSAPICFNPVASRTVLPLQELRTKLGMEGKTPDQIAEGVQAAYAKGELPKMETVAFAYMFSADQDLGPGVGPWHPHMMLYTPYYENSMLGGNQVGGTLPFVGDDAGTPFAVTVIPVAHELAVKTQV